MSGQGADDLMWGDAASLSSQSWRGADLFLFAPDNGRDEIMDFEPGRDAIELDGFGFTSFEDLASHFETTARGVLISFDAGDAVLIGGLQAGDLNARDFILA